MKQKRRRQRQLRPIKRDAAFVNDHPWHHRRTIVMPVKLTFIESLKNAELNEVTIP